MILKKTFALLILVLMVLSQSYSQDAITLPEIQPKKDIENIEIRKLHSDSLSTAFVIFIKKAVKAHYHALHSESIYVISGSGTMTIDDHSFIVDEGSYFNIPRGAVHSLVVDSGEIMKVISFQSPEFIGDDRIFAE